MSYNTSRMMEEMEAMLSDKLWDKLWKPPTKTFGTDSRGNKIELWMVNPNGYDCGFWISVDKVRAIEFRQNTREFIINRYKNVPWC